MGIAVTLHAWLAVVTLLLLANPLVQIVGVAYAAGLVLLRFRVDPEQFRPWVLRLFGFIVPFGSFFGPYGILILSGFTILSFPRRELGTNLRYAIPLFCVYIVWVLAEWIRSVDWTVVFELLRRSDLIVGGQGGTSLLDWWHTNPPDFLLSTWGVFRLIIFLTFFGLLSRSKEYRAELGQGVWIGLIPALILSAIQIFWPHSPWFVQQNEFWLLVERASGSFADPNAFGVSAALLVALLAERATTSGGFRKVLSVFMGLLWICLAFYSGSRSFFVFLAVYAFCWSLVWSRRVSLGLLLLGAILPTVGMTFSQDILNSFSNLPVGIERLLRALEISNISETFQTRKIFLATGLSAWLGNLVFGVGPTNFAAVAIPYADLIEMPLGIWTDNVNNFYLEIFVEVGIVGFIAYVLTGLAVRKQDEFSRHSLYGSVAFFVILLLGPHLHFDEVAIFAALLLSGSFVVGERNTHYWRAVLVAIPLLCCVLFRTHFSDRGYYRWELDSDQYFRWTGRSGASFRRCSQKRNDIMLRYRSLAPHRTTVTVRTQLGDEQELALDPGESGEMTFPCDEITDRLLFYRFTVFPVWIPFGTEGELKALDNPTDFRVLGVQEFVERPSLLLR